MAEPGTPPANEKPAAAKKRGSILAVLGSDQRGAIVVFFALILPILIGFMGMGVEVGYWFSKHRDLQAAADAAALAASYEIAEGRGTNSLIVATREATNNGWDSTDGTITVRGDKYNSTFPATGSFTADDDAVEVVLSLDVDRLFSAYFISSDITIDARAVGKSVAGKTTACVLALGSGNGNDAIKVSGNANITMTGCTVATNSTDDDAFGVQGSAQLTVPCAYSAGGADVTSGLNTTACSGIKTNSPAVVDPYADVLTEPSDSEFDSCTTFSSSGSGDTLNPGVFCAIQFNDNGETLTLNAGTYYIDRGDVRLNSNSTILNATGVTLVFGDSTGGNNCGELKITGGGTFNISAPDANSGEPFPGVVAYRGPTCDASGSAGTELTGNSSSSITGAIYMPSSKLKYSGNSALSGSCVQMIGDTVKFTGSGSISTSCPANSGLLSILAGGVGSLVE